MTPASFTTATPALLGGLMVAAGFVGHAVSTTALPPPSRSTQMQAMEIRPPAKGSAQWYIEKHDCWAGEAPTDAIPGHVIATVGDDVAPTYGGPRLVERALEQLFGGADHGLTVHAFCE